MRRQIEATLCQKRISCALIVCSTRARELPTDCEGRPLAISAHHGTANIMDDMHSKIADAVSHAPAWVRHDLLSDNAMTRERAEETLAAMIANALRLLAA